MFCTIIRIKKCKWDTIIPILYQIQYMYNIDLPCFYNILCTEHIRSQYTILTTGMTWVTPSPESMTVPVRVLSPTWRDVHDAARASTAWTAIYRPGTLNDSNMISAVYSRFSGVFKGGSVCEQKKIITENLLTYISEYLHIRL